MNKFIPLNPIKLLGTGTVKYPDDLKDMANCEKDHNWLEQNGVNICLRCGSTSKSKSDTKD